MSGRAGTARVAGGEAPRLSPIEETTRNQARAAAPDASAWVSANAGTGKTYVLVRRVLRLLLAGTPPEKVLCLTYTKAAASEMANRLFAELGAWAVMPNDRLVETITQLTGQAPDGDTLSRARVLFATTLETPGSLKVQTIHAFCEKVLARFPLEAGIAPNSTLLDDMQAGALREEAMNKVLRQAARKPQSRLGRALLRLVPYADEAQFANLMREAIGKRELLRALIQKTGGGGDPLAGPMAELRAVLGLAADETPEVLREQLAAVLSDGELADAGNVLTASAGKTDQKLGTALRQALHAGDEAEKIAALRAVFLVNGKEGLAPRKTLMSKAVRTGHAALAERLEMAQARFFALWLKALAAKVVVASEALLRLADRVLQEYEAMKAQRAALDFDDLIARTVRLLSAPGEAEWVLYKLDHGFDHILIDEAQDTSPQQWELVRLLAQEFFAGQGAQEGVVRTVFAVGDEKQSIYSFQGAEPALFAQIGRMMDELTRRAGGAFQEIPLTLSFRTTPTVLKAVDKVFADSERVPGVVFDNKVLRHDSFREGEAGLVEIWPVESAEKRDPAAAFDPLADMVAPEDPITRTANRIAATIARWLETGEILESQGRPITPGDILILVKKRNPFVQPMIRALKARGIAVAGADRMRLAEQLAVMDLVALGGFLLLPDDDLALACVLKSPMFGFDDEDLFALGHGRRGSLWGRLWKRAQDADAPARLKAAADWLERWLKRADKVPPYDLYAGILDEDGMRAPMIGRLGAEAADAMDEFLNLALAHDQEGAPSLQVFLEQVRATGLEIKRDMDQGRDEVRIMTVHGAKGLEAEVVFLPDTCSVRGASGREALMALEPAAGYASGRPQPLVWAIPDAKHIPAVAALRARRQQAELEEYYRLLYVAMTRARERLYVCGFEGLKRRPASCWYDVIFEALAQDMEELEEDGRKLWRWREAQQRPLKAPQVREAVAEPAPLPTWATTPARHEQTPLTLLTPSTLLPPELAESRHEQALANGQEEADDTPALGRDERILRGLLCHTLLEHLPSLPKEARQAAAVRILAQDGASLPDAVRAQITDEVFAILEAPEFAALFAPGSAAEVPLLYDIQTGKGIARMTGNIDRLVVCEDEIWIIDYKTNREVPATPQQAPMAYRMQLAAYQMGVARLYEDRPVKCGLLWTRTRHLMWIGEDLLSPCRDMLAQGLGDGVDAAAQPA